MEEALSQKFPMKSIPLPILVRQRTTTSCECKICRGPARYSYYGAIVCNACKVFFKRNTAMGQTALKCRSVSQCDIQYVNGHMCSSCRLNKCFSNGMNTQLIRAPHSTKNKTRRQIKSIVESRSSEGQASVKSIDECQSIQNPTLNLLETDQSILNMDQWTRLSNLVHCFDKYSRYSFIKQYVQNQNALPPKFRYKCSSVKDFLGAINSNAQVVCAKTRDVLSLSSHDRSTLLRTTVQHTSGIIAVFIVRQYQLLDNLSYYKSAELILEPSSVAVFKRAIERLDPDDTFVKVIVAALAFSTTNYTIYDETSSCDSIDVKSTLSMQDSYTELAWRYLSFKYGHEQAVIRISNLLRCLFLVNEAIVEAHKSDQFTGIMNSILAQTEQKLGL